MKKKFYFVISLFLTITCFAQEKGSLHVPAEYEEIGQNVYEGFEYIFSRVEEYAKASAKISKSGVDSIRRVATSEFIGLNPSVEKYLSGQDALTGITVTPQLQAFIDEILATVQKYNTKDGLEKLANQLGKINRKAAATLSETDAKTIYAISCTTFYSTKYWLTNATKWAMLGEFVKKKL